MPYPPPDRSSPARPRRSLPCGARTVEPSTSRPSTRPGARASGPSPRPVVRPGSWSASTTPRGPRAGPSSPPTASGSSSPWGHARATSGRWSCGRGAKAAPGRYAPGRCHDPGHLTLAARRTDRLVPEVDPLITRVAVRRPGTSVVVTFTLRKQLPFSVPPSTQVVSEGLMMKSPPSI